MTSGLRKTHRFIWITLGLLVSSLIALSTIATKKPLEIDKDFSVVSKHKTQRAVFEDAYFVINLNEKNELNNLEIILKKPLKSASSLVYGYSNNSKNLLGSIDTKGRYTFTIDKFTTSIAIYDEIKKTNIAKIKL